MKETATEKWNECLTIIRQGLDNDTAYATWFEPTEAVSLRGSVLTLKLQSAFVKELYEDRYFDILASALRKVIGPNVSIIYSYPVVKDARGASVKVRSASVKENESGGNKEEIEKKKEIRASARDDDEFLPKMNEALTFDNFCVSPCNKLPWTIAESIARQPVNSTFNPFFLYGDVGVGKTHLMQAIGLHVKKTFPEKKVVFLPMKEFQRLYQNAYLKKEIPAFLQWFMKCDVLLFDDLQEIVGSEGTLNNALFPIFSHLQMSGRQLVFTCDRPPQDLKDLEARLIDRFKWGIVEKLERPDTTLRKKILTFKARKNGLDLPGAVIDYISGVPLNSVREIEGIVLKIMTRAITLGADIDVEMAKVVVEQSVRPSSRRTLNFDMIVEGAADAYRLNSDVIFSKSRVKDVADARMAIMFLAQRLIGLTAGAIGRKLGRKHSTVLHGIKTVARRIDEEPEFATLISEIEKNL